MHRQDPCDGLLKKKVGDLLTEENLKRQLLNCLDSEFKNDGLRFWYDEDLIVTYGSKFFSKLCFKSRRRISERKLSGFHKTMIGLEKNPKFAGEFSIDRSEKPTLIKPRMKMRLFFGKLLERINGTSEISTEYLIHYIQNLWEEIVHELVMNSRYNIRMRNP